MYWSGYGVLVLNLSPEKNEVFVYTMIGGYLVIFCYSTRENFLYI